MKSKAERIIDESIEAEFKSAFLKQKRQKAKTGKRKKVDPTPIDQMDVNKLLEDRKKLNESFKVETQKQIQEYAQLTSPTYGTSEIFDTDALKTQTTDHPSIKEAHLPNKCVWSFTSKNPTISSIRFHPNGNIFGFCGNDGDIKLFGLEQRKCISIFHGHQMAMCGMEFIGNTMVVGASLDGTIKVWDIEKGEVMNGWDVIDKESEEKKGFKCLCVNKDCIVGGNTNKCIYQYDIRDKQKISQYMCNALPLDITCCGKGFMCTTDQRSIKYFDWGCNAVTKELSDPLWQTMSSVANYNKKYVVAQSMDNSIICFRGSPFREMKGRRFMGHYVGGYPCHPTFSKDGKYLTSGDGNGKVFIWDWKTGKIVKKFEKAHTKCCVDVQWHPYKQSTLLSCGWDGKVCLWE
ncbi:Pre-mRNA-processing factor [Entamoeba marina]